MYGRGHTIVCRSPKPKSYISVYSVLVVPKKEVILAGHLSGQLIVCSRTPYFPINMHLINIMKL